ncbi:MAG: hypothetical protein N4A44_04220 [Alphaproteobacteria bacterium]|jgi:hypothetical protein|nr:hypothetical protein [Alphaproteobacteria bacterium]
MALSKNASDLFFLMKVWKENGVRISDNLNVYSSDNFINSETSFREEIVYETEDADHIIFADLNNVVLNEKGFIISYNGAFLRDTHEYYGKVFKKKETLVVDARFYFNDKNGKTVNYFENMKELSEEVAFKTKFYNSENDVEGRGNKNGFSIKNHRLQGYRARVPLDSNNFDHQVFINAYNNLLHSNNMNYGVETYNDYDEEINPDYVGSLYSKPHLTDNNVMKTVENLSSSVLYDDEELLLRSLYGKKKSIAYKDEEKGFVRLAGKKLKHHLDDLKDRNVKLFDEIVEFKKEFIANRDFYGTYENFLSIKKDELENPENLIPEITEEDMLMGDLEEAKKSLDKKIKQAPKQYSVFSEEAMDEMVDPDLKKEREDKILKKIGKRADKHARKKIAEEEASRVKREEIDAERYLPSGWNTSTADNASGPELAELTGNYDDYAVPANVQDMEEEEEVIRMEEKKKQRKRIYREKGQKTIA